MADLKHTPAQTLAVVEEYDAALARATADFEKTRDLDAWIVDVNRAAAFVADRHQMSEAYLEAAWSAWSHCALRAA